MFTSRLKPECAFPVCRAANRFVASCNILSKKVKTAISHLFINPFAKASMILVNKCDYGNK